MCRVCPLSNLNNCALDRRECQNETGGVAVDVHPGKIVHQVVCGVERFGRVGKCSGHDGTAGGAACLSARSGIFENNTVGGGDPEQPGAGEERLRMRLPIGDAFGGDEARGHGDEASCKADAG